MRRELLPRSRDGQDVKPDTTVLKFDSSGKLVASFGAGMLIFPHGIHVDRDGNVWVTDGQDNAPVRRAAAALAPAHPPRLRAAHGSAARRDDRASGLQVQPRRQAADDARQAGRRAPSPTIFYQPNDVYVAPNGDIFVSEGHGGANARILKFSQGRQVHQGVRQEGHAARASSISRTRSRSTRRAGCSSATAATTASRSSIRTASSSPSGRSSAVRAGIYIDKNDMLYVADSESGSVNPAHGAWKRGIRIGSAKDGKVDGFIPDPDDAARQGTSAAEGVVVDSCRQHLRRRSRTARRSRSTRRNKHSGGLGAGLQEGKSFLQCHLSHLADPAYLPFRPSPPSCVL